MTATINENIINDVNSFQELVKEAKEKIKKLFNERNQIIVGYGTCGIATGADEVYEEFEKILGELQLEDYKLEKTGCIGCCSEEVMVDIKKKGEARVSYKGMTPKDVKEVLTGHINGTPVMEKVLGVFPKQPNLLDEEMILKPEDKTLVEELQSFYEIPQMGKQLRIMLRNVGLIDPEKLGDYLTRGGFQAIIKAITEMSPMEVVEEVKASGLRGRGGAGFPTGLKWQFANNTQSDEKYIVCNADEGDPGAFMDRAIIEGDPYALLEGMMIGGYAIGAQKGFIYIRAEYPLAIYRLELALKQLQEKGILGKNILGTEFTFEIEIRKGAGAFVCGEETALMNSIMGLRGEPRTRPPYPAVSGLWGKPTNINNVKTYVNVPAILIKGADWYNSIGTEDTKGTAVFALAGDVVNAGLVEVPMGITLREIIFEIGGGILDNKKFKAVQTGGPSGGCLPESMLDIEVDFASLGKAGSIMGSGGMIVCSEDTCIVDLSRYFLSFTQHESCGKCTPCREGTLRALEMLEKITRGEGEMSDLDELEELANVIKDTSLCGLGQTAPNPVLSTLKYFREEYEQHIIDKKCQAKICATLYEMEIRDEADCNRCGLCFRICPVNAISGSKEIGYEIDNNLCTRCGLCYTRCPKGSIFKVN
ncbi:MAG: NADH-quinone oxidoreductase subunit NuoF [Candidatus Kariarchaeaceae archaeon]